MDCTCKDASPLSNGTPSYTFSDVRPAEMQEIGQRRARPPARGGPRPCRSDPHATPSDFGLKVRFKVGVTNDSGTGKESGTISVSAAIMVWS